MAKIVLIDCEKPANIRTDHYEYPPHTEPLGLEYLQAYLDSHNHDTHILQLPNASLESSVKNADVIGFSVLTYQWPFFKELANKVRELNPSAILVAGREHPTAFPELCLKKTAIDCVVCGEGEIPLLQIANGISSEKIPGIAFWKDGKIVINPRPSRLKKWPYAKRNKNRMTITLKEWLPLGNKAAGIMLSRGCCFSCDFCTKQQMWGNGYFCQNIDLVIDEIIDIQNQYGISIFAFHDLMLPPKLLEKFCARILQRNVDAKFFAMMSATTDIIDWKLVESAGFFEIGVGLEIPNDQRGNIGKKHPFAIAKAFINSIADANILTRVYTIIGWPHDTNVTDVVKSYLSGLSEIIVHILRVHFLTPFPGTKLWNKYQNNFIYPVPEGFSHFTTMEPVLKFEMDTESLLRARKEIISEYYNSSHFSRICAKLKTKQREMVDIFRGET
jgi:radical SAM superfamily enzyme YgiQ (UPF0313 family)